MKRKQNQKKKLKTIKRKVLEVVDTSSQIIPFRTEARIKEGWVTCTGWASRVEPGDTLILREDGKTKLILTAPRLIPPKVKESDWF